MPDYQFTHFPDAGRLISLWIWKSDACFETSTAIILKNMRYAQHMQLILNRESNIEVWKMFQGFVWSSQIAFQVTVLNAIVCFELA